MVSLDLNSRRALVTGGARGIGKSIAVALATAGADVHVIDVGEPEENNSERITYHSADITDVAVIHDLVQAIGGPIDVLVNNAGITRDRTLMKMTTQEWNDVIGINLTGAFNMIHAVAPVMAAHSGGSIVNITSINGIRGKIGQANYSASKAGLIGLTKTAARELGRKSITVNAVAPGMVLTDMARQLPQDILDRALAETALNKLAEPADIANAVVFLASNAARMITGQVLQVDAGQLM